MNGCWVGTVDGRFYLNRIRSIYQFIDHALVGCPSQLYVSYICSQNERMGLGSKVILHTQALQFGPILSQPKHMAHRPGLVPADLFRDVWDREQLTLSRSLYVFHRMWQRLMCLKQNFQNENLLSLYSSWPALIAQQRHLLIHQAPNNEDQWHLQGRRSGAGEYGLYHPFYLASKSIQSSSSWR